jgi:hypothetical protein
MNRAAQQLGRLGGKVKSAAKAAAAKENGKRGGRPKKAKNELHVQKL